MGTWTLSLISGGREVNLSDGVGYFLTDVSGIGMAPMKNLTETGPQQHGASFVGYRLQPRKIQLGFTAMGGDVSAYFAMRDALLSLFRPSDTPLSLKLAYGDTRRQIDCYFSAALDLAPEIDVAPNRQKVVVELVALDPTWYDPNGTSVTYGIGGSGQTMQVPLAVPWSVGAAAIDTTRQIAYAGTWDAFPVVTVKGPVTDLVIVNETLGDKLDFTGVALAAGEQRIIDTRYGRKTVVDQNGANKIADLTGDSNLATFRIGAHPVPLNGNNSIRVSGTNITAGTEIYLQYNTRFVGV